MLIIFDLDDTLINTSSIMVGGYTEKKLDQISLFPGVKEFLNNFKGKKVLVTKETDLGLQNRKIDFLGIRNYFNLILICYTDKEKKTCFQKVLAKFPNQDIWVVGDRIDAEIRYGNELGLKTVRFKQGKYKDLKIKDSSENPNYEVKSFLELFKLVT